MGDKAAYMRELRKDYQAMWRLLWRMMQAIDPHPRHEYRKCLDGTLRHAIYILDECFPDWREREKLLMPSTELGQKLTFPEIEIEWPDPTSLAECPVDN